MRLWTAQYTTQARASAALHGDSAGSPLVTETLYLPDERSVREALLARGLTPVHIYPYRKPWWSSLGRRAEWQKQIINALRFQSSTRSAGTALRNIAEHEPNPARRQAMLPMRAVIAAGGSFVGAVRTLNLYDRPTLAILAAGEASGRLAEAFREAAAHLDGQTGVWRQLTAAAAWIAVEFAMVYSGVAGLQFYFLPSMTEQAKSMSADQADVLLGAADMIWWLNGALLAVLTGACLLALWLAAVWTARRGKPGNNEAISVLRRMPMVGGHMAHSALARSMRMLARLLRAGVPVDRALGICRDVADDQRGRAYWAGTLERIRAGVPPARAMSEGGLDPHEAEQLLTTTDTAAQMPLVLDAIADERAHRADLAIKAFSRSMTYGMVGIGTLSILLSLWLMQLQGDGTMDILSNALQ